MARTSELIAQYRNKTRLQDQQRQAQTQVDEISLQIDLDRSRRGENLELLRWYYMNERQDPFVSMLGIGSQSRYSAIVNGKSTLDNTEARKIETELNLPRGWLDRDNSKTIFLSNDEWQLVQELRRSEPNATTSLRETMKHMRLSRSEH